MLKTTTYILSSLIFCLTACLHNENNSSTQNTDDISELHKTTKDLDGYWVLTDYIDSIFKDKAIGKHSRYPISMRIVDFRIQNDSLFSEGIIMNGFRDKISLINDTLKQIHYPYTFYYNSKLDRIEVTSLNPKGPLPLRYTDKEKYTYRRVTESRLTNLFAQKYGIRSVRLEDSFHQLLIDSLIGGEYKSIKSGQKLLLTNLNSHHSYSTSGFMRFNKYDIYDYLEYKDFDEYEYNPFQSNDVIIFREHRGDYSEDNIPKWIKFAAYNWQFSGDTLTLTEMVDTRNPNARYGKYFLGTKKFRFIRTK